ncbi:TRAP transporter small permease [Polaromonas sp. CG_9.11]|uniref:TRAP transporter small permease n=1 Tax=Polaromonas sp. CG_9.11 TaxID=2787730 RepID=UPI0018CA6DFD|nr:TRAP transporter small permease [Polaromonas sp. CG_9.11]MBG6074389.1 TRAP-type C4-dicarboxylate transport system permease small subunit [Polaromonas sp. CG_9.11]
MKNNILRFNDILYLACIWISGAAVFVMSLIIPWGIFARYVLGTGSQWPEPVSILLMVVFTFFGAAATYRAGAHIAVAMITDRLPASLRWLCARAVDLLMLAVAMFMTFYGFKLVMGTWGQTIGDLPWMPVGATYLPVPVGGLLTLAFILEHMLIGYQGQRAVVTFDHEKIEAGAL